jgi:hypothetical protein
VLLMWTKVCIGLFYLPVQSDLFRVHLYGMQMGAAPSEEDGPAERLSKSFGTFVTLQDLINGGFIQPGSGVLTVSYKGMHWSGDLMENGTIQADGHVFTKLTQFAVAMIQKENPTRKSSNGWEVTSFAGRCAWLSATCAYRVCRPTLGCAGSL